MSATIRYRKTHKGYSVYLDVYHKGKRTYEYPEIYVSKDYSGMKNFLKEDKDKIEFVEKLRDKTNFAIKEGKYGFTPSSLRNADFIKYFEKIAAEKKHPSYLAALQKLKDYAKNGRIPFSELNENTIKGFIKYLSEQDLAENSIYHYLMLMTIAINRAIQDKIITENPVRFIPKEMKPKKQQIQKEFLTIEELRLLKNTPIQTNPIVAQAFLFGCYTGLRISDISKLKRSEIIDGQIQYRQKKSKQDFHYLPLNDTAKAILKELPPPANTDYVFSGLPSICGRLIYHLKIWAAKAGVKKNIGWHTARHTFAVNYLTYGGDIYSLKELLGHSSVTITEIYGKIVNTKKKEMINNIPAL